MSLRDCIHGLPEDLQVVAFYSYKGGVGRTMALCNVAAQISRLHTKRQTEAKKNAPGATIKPLRILCLDLDLEAPGIPAYLPPVRGTRVKGFLGILAEYFGKDGKSHWESEVLQREIRRALGSQLSDYAYAVPDTDNLFVMPTGSLDTDELIRVRRALEELLEPIRRPGSLGEAKKLVPFFTELRTALREQFDYTFVDSRTGLADTSYATTAVLADAMVFLFRPNLTQLAGIQDVFGRFLIENPDRASETQLQRMPAIPVLSPRPNYSTPRLQEVRKAAAERIFRWLDSTWAGHSKGSTDRYAPTPPKMQELPFDSSLEIGERLMIPPNPNAEIEDEHAPLYSAYVELAGEVQKRNVARDTLAARVLEQEHYRSGRKDEALDWLLAAIAAEPSNIGQWESIWEGYSAHLGSSPAARDQVMRFCTEALALPEAQTVPRFFGALWLSEVYEKLAPDRCPQLITDLWRMARSSMDSTLLSHSLTRLYKYYDKRRGEPELRNCPPRAQTHAAWMLERIHLRDDVQGLLRTLVGAEDYFKEQPETGIKGLELLQDQLCLTARGEEQSLILRDIARAHVLQGDVRSAYKAYAAAVLLPECSEKLKRSFVFLQMRALPRMVVEESIRSILPSVLQTFPLMMLEIREGSSVEEVRARLDQLRKHDRTVAEDPIFEYYALMHHRRFAEARLFMGERLGKVRRGVEVKDLARLRLAQWLSEGGTLDEEIAAYAEGAVADPEFVLNELDFDVCLALACCSQELGREASKRLSQAQWPLAKFGWTFVSCIAGQDYRMRRTELETMLSDNPFLACQFRKQEDFPLLRFILERHESLGNLKPDAMRKRMEVIGLVSGVKVNFGAPPETAQTATADYQE